MSGSQKILIVDDKPANLLALQQTLSQTDAEIVEATSGDEALRSCLNHEFALAILDVQMPTMDGYELAGFLRSDEKTRQIPIIFLTATLREERDIFKGYESGAVDYILKPYRLAILLGKVQVFLQLDRQRAELAGQQVFLEAANRELEAFAYSVSHDLRAPLRCMDGFSQALLRNYADQVDEQGRHYLERICAGARQMGRLIDDLLNLSRISRSKMRSERVDLSTIAYRIAGALQKEQEGRDVELVLEKGITVDGDPALLRAVLENLLGNAWKFTAKQAKARIKFGAFEQEGERVYFVRDNGAGFDMAYADKLFGAFQRLHRQDEFEGTGIGLATVQRIVRRHGGRVWAEGTPGEGATFYFTLGA